MLNSIMDFIIIQFIGIVGFGLTCITPLWKTTKHMLIVGALASMLFVIHYLLLGAWAGAAIDVICASRCILAAYYPKTWVKWMFYLSPFAILFLNPINLANTCVCIAALINSISSFKTDAQTMRVMDLSSIPFWTFYNFTNLSYAGLIANFVGFVSYSYSI
jgi:hypothetical protein